MALPSSHKDHWISLGYEMFALDGPGGIKIEPLAKRVGKNKSSFYHFFADLEIFMDELLEHHIQQSKQIALKEQAAQNIDPELIEILLEHRIDVLFNRQLRIHRSDPQLLATLETSNAIIGHSFVLLWVRDLEITLSQHQLESIFELALENFYLQIHAENLRKEWLSEYFARLKKIVLKLARPA